MCNKLHLPQAPAVLVAALPASYTLQAATDPSADADLPSVCHVQHLKPVALSPSTGKFTTTRVSMGALGDSYYEYLLKTWLLKGKADGSYRTMWVKAMDEMLASLLFESSPSRFKFIADFNRCACTIQCASSTSSWCHAVVQVVCPDSVGTDAVGTCLIGRISCTERLAASKQNCFSAHGGRAVPLICYCQVRHTYSLLARSCLD